MRELKFRAWSKKHNSYLKFRGIQYDDDKIEGVFVVYGTVAGIPNTICLGPEDVILEQYTGLKDKNGKEIYEGDILEFDKNFDDTAQRYVPYFDEELAAFGFGVYDYQDYISESGSEEFESEISLIGTTDNYEREEIIFYTEYVSIVGNIHENDDLLGEICD